MAFVDSKVKEALLQIPELTEEKLFAWLKTPPRFSVLRVNLTLNTRTEFTKKLKLFLDEQYESKPFPVPKIIICDELEEVVIVESSGLNPKFVPTIKEAIVGVLCGCAVMRGSDVFAPGVMNIPTHLKVGDVVSVYADVEKKCLKGSTKQFKSNERVFVGNGIALMNREDLFKSDQPRGVAIKMTDPLFDCPSFSELTSNGCAMLQNLPSILCSHLLLSDIELVQDVRVLDMCAAPGGKTTHLAEILKRKKIRSKVVAMDKSKNKLKNIEENCRRLKLDNVSIHGFDSTKSLKEEVSNAAEEEEDENPPFAKESFDRILLDAPCTALGQRPQFLIQMKEKEFRSFPKLQKKLFSTAHELLKPGGILIYSTCSPSLEENEEIVDWALENFATTLSLETTEPIFGKKGIRMAKKENSGRVQRFFTPQESCEKLGYKNDTIGFFIAKFRKK